MDYCLGDADGSATMWSASPDIDIDGDGTLDSVGLDFDSDGLIDDAMADTDGDGLADQMVRDHASQPVFFTDDGTGTWGVSVDRGGQLRWFGLDGIEHTGGPVVDVDADGQVDDTLLDVDGNGLADRAIGGGAHGTAYVDTDGDGRWDVKLVDSDGDARADAATEL
jgi:hypothetical protein